MVTRMLETAIEIEGLLRIIRDGEPSAETYALLNKKTSELTNGVAGLDKNVSTRNVEVADADFVMSAPEMDFVMTTPEARGSQSEVVFAEQDAAMTINATGDLALDEEDDIILTFDDSADEDPEPEAAVEEAEAENVEEPEKVKEEEEKVNKEEENEKEEEKAAVATKPKPRLKSAFSLNDRFLYARELFGGNMKDFDSTLETIEGIDDFSLIEEYFYNELGWDKENANVAAFMEIVRR